MDGNLRGRRCMQEQRSHENGVARTHFQRDFLGCFLEPFDICGRAASYAVSTAQDPERAIPSIAVVEVNADGNHLFEHLCRRLDVDDPALHTPRTIVRHIKATLYGYG